VNFVETGKQDSMFRDSSFAFLECLSHGDLRWAEELFCLLLRQNMSCSELAKEILFVQKFLGEMGNKLESLKWITLEPYVLPKPHYKLKDQACGHKISLCEEVCGRWNI